MKTNLKKYLILKESDKLKYQDNYPWTRQHGTMCYLALRTKIKYSPYPVIGGRLNFDGRNLDERLINCIEAQFHLKYSIKTIRTLATINTYVWEWSEE